MTPDAGVWLGFSYACFVHFVFSSHCLIHLIIVLLVSFSFSITLLSVLWRLTFLLALDEYHLLNDVH